MAYDDRRRWPECSGTASPTTGTTSSPPTSRCWANGLSRPEPRPYIVASMPSFPLPNDLGDEVVVLRPFGDGDVRAAFEACTDPLIARHTKFPTPEHEEQTRA